MDIHAEKLTQARHAYAAHDWPTAAARFDEVAPERLTADDLAAYADAAWWLGRIEDNLRLGAAACEAFVADSRPGEAAWAAFLLGIFHLSRGDEPQGMGWMGRAGRIVEEYPDSPIHGYLLKFHRGGGEPHGRPTGDGTGGGPPSPGAWSPVRRSRASGHRLAQ